MALRLFLLAFTLVFLLGACSKGKDGPPRNEAQSHYLLGASALAENNPTEALKEFLLAEKSDSDNAEIQSGLARAYMQKKAFDLAEKHYLEAIDISDGAPQYYNNLGALYLTIERYDDAIVVFRKAAENLLFSTPEIAWTGIGLAYFKKHDYAAAEQYYFKARALNSRYAPVHFRLGELYYHHDRPVEAANAFVRAVELAPRMVEGHYWLGQAAMKMRDNDQARIAFQETIKLAPESEQARQARSYLKILK